MKCVTIPRPDVVTIQEAADPVPMPGHALLRILTSSIQLSKKGDSLN